jgi:hypothetical protein
MAPMVVITNETGFQAELCDEERPFKGQSGRFQIEKVSLMIKYKKPVFIKVDFFDQINPGVLSTKSGFLHFSSNN